MIRQPATLLRSLSLMAALAVVAACGTATGDLGTVAPPPPTSAPSIDAPSPEATPGGTPSTSPDGSVAPSPSASPAGTTTIRAYFFLGSSTHDAGLVPVLREIPKTQAVGAAAMNALLAGPAEAEMAARPAMYTTVPEDTRFLGLTIEDGIATVDLSREFESGGGTASVIGRLAQVVYTLTQFQTVKGVRFELDGRPVDVFSGEGIILDHPVDRKDYEQLLPTILVDSPTPWAEVSNPVTISGSANVFEANVTVRILDERNREIAHTFTTATCGTGCRGTFSVDVPYEVDERQQGVILVQDDDAAGVGKPPHEVRIPVILVPA